LQYIKFTPSIILLYPPPFHFWKFQYVSFLHLHTCVHIIPPYSPSYTLSLYTPCLTSTNPPDRTCFALLFSVFI
jgi:hypothetical protein